MSSILTNTSAMIALHSLRTSNADLDRIEKQISTGKIITEASDNAAIWAISKVMESDHQSTNAISKGLALGQSTLKVATKATESTINLLKKMKAEIIAAQSENTDRDKIQNQLEALKDQIRSAVRMAQFNGLNLLDGSQDPGIEILSSIDRNLTGQVKAAYITVPTDKMLKTRNDTPAKPQVFQTGRYTSDTINPRVMDPGQSTRIKFSNTGHEVGSVIKLKFGAIEVNYKITQSDINASAIGKHLAKNLAAAVLAKNIPNITVRAGLVLRITNTSSTASITLSGQTKPALNIPDLADINVLTTDKAAKSMEMIEDLTNHWIKVAEGFGTYSRRISIQTAFISNITDTFQSGIGSLVDADMEETAALAIALKVQVQLSTESLSIANKSPHFLYQLFK